jgi:Helix-turn-helix domain
VIRAPIPAEHLIHGLDAPVVLVSGRVAAWLLSRAGLDEYHRSHRGDDPEVDQVLVALKLAAIAWRERKTSTDHGTREAGAPPHVAPSPKWFTTAAAARVLGITARAVIKAISVGRLPAVWSAGRWWIDPDDVEHYRAQRAA